MRVNPALLIFVGKILVDTLSPLFAITSERLEEVGGSI
jgi:hypothetical protein